MNSAAFNVIQYHQLTIQAKTQKSLFNGQVVIGNAVQKHYSHYSN